MEGILNFFFPSNACGAYAAFCLVVIAMRALKDSLHVPDRMGWNGDPCAPTDWDAWEGVTCHADKNGTGLVITQM